MRRELADESEFIERVKREQELDRKKDREAKQRKMLEAEKVLVENAKAERIREAQRQVEIQQDIKIAQLREQQELDQETRRQAEWDARAAKIGHTVAHMANTVGKQLEEQERKNAEKLRKHQEDKKLRDEEDEKERKRMMNLRLEEMRKGLDDQMRERERAVKQEVKDNQEYMKSVVAKAEVARSKQE